ncbi:hypothetical protein [Streptomyces formicae]|nr:hypothetical protein [Streptomyces formicae]
MSGSTGNVENSVSGGQQARHDLFAGEAAALVRSRAGSSPG